MLVAVLGFWWLQWQGTPPTVAERPSDREPQHHGQAQPRRHATIAACASCWPKTTRCSATACAPACASSASRSTGCATARRPSASCAPSPTRRRCSTSGCPLKDGLDVLAAVRRAGITLPVLVLTARDAVPDRIRGLDAGADDYVVKPVDLDELAARLRALVRRAHGQPQERLGAQDVVLDPAARSVRRPGAGDAVGARVRSAAGADAQCRPRAVARAARAAPLQLGPGSGEQRDRGAHPPPAAQARRRR